MDSAESRTLDRRAHRHECQPEYGVARHAPTRIYASGAAPQASARGHRRRARGIQKKLGETVADLARAYPEDAVELWTQDEARLGLKPILRRQWAPRGQRPIATARPAYEWLWVYAAVHPQSGRVFWLVLPSLNAALMQRFLDEFARTHATPGQRIVMVMDGAAAHRATTLRVPERITLVRLPPYTPELNPTERLWTMVREGVANRDFSTLDGLEQSICTRCQKISAVPEQVTALTSYHWLPTT